MNKKIVIIIISVICLLCVIVTVYTLTDKKNMYHIDINNPNLIKTENGYKEELVIEETEIINKYVKEGKYRRNAPNIKTTYNIMYYNEELKENVEIDVEKSKYDNFSIGDKIKVTRTVYYDKNGLRLYYEDTAEKLQDN